MHPTSSGSAAPVTGVSVGQPVVLSVGQHPSRDQGACLMEVVSQAAGERWSDAPACVHPLLGHLARLVNDSVSDRNRHRLLALVPALTTATDRAPTTYPRMALACTERALETRSLLLAHLHWVAHRELTHEVGLTAAASRADVRAALLLRRALFQRGPAARAVEASVAALLRSPQPDRDAALIDLLETAVHVVNGVPGPRATTPRLTVA
jgi:hypothetical protein